MSDESKTASQIDPLLRSFLDVWSSFAPQVSESTRKLFETYDRSGNSPRLSREWLDSARDSMDNYLRSPEFLSVMKQNIDVMIKTKQQLNGLYRELARQAGISTSGDIHELSKRLRGAGQSIRARLNDIENNLATIDEKLAQMASSDV
jgi:hypothetical protein